jgi:hypothetical protein
MPKDEMPPPGRMACRSLRVEARNDATGDFEPLKQSEMDLSSLRPVRRCPFVAANTVKSAALPSYLVRATRNVRMSTGYQKYYT